MLNCDLISVIVPVYNVETYLNRCIESIVNQSYSNLEIILIDDGSTDNCPVMCDEWARKDQRIRSIHKENGGVASARNTGLETAVGEFVGWVDSDDWIDKDYFFNLHYKLLNSNAEIAINRNDGGDESEEVFYGKEIFKYLLLGKLSTTLWSTLMYSKLLKGEKFKDYPIGEDYEMLCRAFEKSSSVISYNINEYHYTIRSDSAVHETNLESMKIWLQVETQITDYIEDKYSDLANVCAFRKLKLANSVRRVMKDYGKTDEVLKFLNVLRKIILKNAFKVPYYLLDYTQIKSVLSAIKFALKL